MRLLLAVYDPAHESSDGKYWVWSHPDLTDELKNRFYYNAAVKHLPENPNAITPSDCHGGWTSIDETWACWYRFLDGGRDLRGRPGRFVLICAFCRRTDNINLNGFSILDSAPFQRLAQATAFSRPIPQPESLECDVRLPAIEGSSAAVQNSHDAPSKFVGPKATERAAAACCNLQPSYGFDVAYIRSGDRSLATVEITKSPEAKVSKMVGPTNIASVSRPSPPTGPRHNASVANEALSERYTRTAARASLLFSASIPNWAVLIIICVVALGAYFFGARNSAEKTPIINSTSNDTPSPAKQPSVSGTLEPPSVAVPGIQQRDGTQGKSNSHSSKSTPTSQTTNQ